MGSLGNSMLGRMENQDPESIAFFQVCVRTREIASSLCTACGVAQQLCWSNISTNECVYRPPLAPSTVYI